MTAASSLTSLPEDIRSALAAKAFLFDHPADFLAGVDEAVRVLSDPRSRIVVVDEGGRQEWLRTLEQYRAACGPPATRSARAFESTLERQLSA